MREGGPDDLRTTLVIGARLLCGWACVAVAVLDLFMGLETGPYLLFHLVLLVGGVLLLGLGKLRKPFSYAVIFALAVVTLVVAALPATSRACCMRGLDARHGYPLTVLGWDHGQQVHFAPAHAVADLTFWFLVWLLLRVALASLRPHPATPSPRRRSPLIEQAGPVVEGSALPADGSAGPALPADGSAGPDLPADGSADAALPADGSADAARPPGGESVGGLP